MGFQLPYPSQHIGWWAGAVYNWDPILKLFLLPQGQFWYSKNQGVLIKPDTSSLKCKCLVMFCGPWPWQECWLAASPGPAPLSQLGI